MNFWKSNFVVPDNENEVPTGILKQMAIYLEALTIVYPNKEIEIAILWIKNLKLMYLDDFSVISTLDIFNWFVPIKVVTSPNLPGISGNESHKVTL